MLSMMLLLILVPIPNQFGMYVSMECQKGFSSPVSKNSLIRYPLFGELHSWIAGSHRT